MKPADANTNIIPIPPLSLEKIDDESLKNLQSWITSIQSISLEIKISSIFDESFDCKKTYDQIYEFLKKDYLSTEIHNLEAEDILFYVGLPNSLATVKKKYLLKDGYFFCKRDKAFYIEYGFDKKMEDREDPEDDECIIQYEVCSPQYQTWEQIIKIIIASIKDLTTEIPAFKSESKGPA